MCTRFFSGLRDFWEEKDDSYLFHRGIIAVKDNFILKPKNGDKCKDQEVTCVLKQGRGQPDIPMEGNCGSGWTIDASDLWNSSGTKLLCETKENARWHFYVFPFGKPTIFFPPLCRRVWQWKHIVILCGLDKRMFDAALSFHSFTLSWVIKY